MDWVIYAFGVSVHFLTLMVIFGLWGILQDPRVQYGGAKVIVKWFVFVPFIAVIFFWSWFFFA